MPYKQVVLVVLDGFGVASYTHGNAIALANPEILHSLVARFPSATLLASGPVVGLPWGEVGNSEVGHLNMGAGRIVGQDLPRINAAISDHTFFANQVLLEAVKHVLNYNSSLHLMGLVSGGGVHSSDEHMYALLGLAAEQGVKNVYIHMFTDGRDTGEKDAIDSARKLQVQIKKIGAGKVVSVSGRFYAMDRGRHWDQTELVYQTLVNGKGNSAETLEDAIFDCYSQGIYDEMIPPTLIANRTPEGELLMPVKISDNDAVVFSNFRSDRAIQLTKAFVKPEEMDIEKKHEPLKNLFFVSMTEYSYDLPVKVAFPPVSMSNNLSETISKAGFKQFHAAESEKYAHVTSFFNGGASNPYPGEVRKIVTSPSNNKHYDLHPEMSGHELTEEILAQIKLGEANFILANYANPDMVGHTGNLRAAIKAVQFIDKFLGRISEAVLASNGALIITGDHGNVEQMLNLKTGEIDKGHSTSPIPFILVASEYAFSEPKEKSFLSLSSAKPIGIISDIAPTVLQLLGLPKPVEMTSVSLISSIN